MASALDFHLEQLSEARSVGRESEFELDPAACADDHHIELHRFALHAPAPGGLL